MHEFELINKYFSKLTNKSKSSLNLNDDVFFDKKKNLVVSVDTYIEGKHFINFKNPELTIKKVIRSSISDLICKGVKPKYYFISASGDKNSFSKNFPTLFLGLGAFDTKKNSLLFKFKFFKTSMADWFRLIPLCTTPQRSIRKTSYFL